MFQQEPTLLLSEANEADSAGLRNGRASCLASGKNRIYPGTLHDKIELAELTPDLICQRPASCIARHDCLRVRGRMIVPQV